MNDHISRRGALSGAVLAALAASSQAVVAQRPATPEIAGDSARTPTRRTVLDQTTPEASFLLLIDYQSQFVFSTRSHDIDLLVNNAQGLAKAARLFEVPTLMMTVTAGAFGGPMLEEIRSVFPDQPVIDRTVINAWADSRVSEPVRQSGRRKLIIAGLWTDKRLTQKIS